MIVDVLNKLLPDHRLDERPAPYKSATQTALYGDTAEKPGERLAKDHNVQKDRSGIIDEGFGLPSTVRMAGEEPRNRVLRGDLGSPPLSLRRHTRPKTGHVEVST